MSVLPWQAANAQLLDVRTPGTMAWSGDVDAQGSVLWSGTLEAQIQRSRRTVLDGGTWVDDERDVLIVREPPETLSDAQTGDEGVGCSVLVRDMRDDTPVNIRFRLTAIEHRGIGEAEHVHAELADPRVL